MKWEFETCQKARNVVHDGAFGGDVDRSYGHVLDVCRLEGSYPFEKGEDKFRLGDGKRNLASGAGHVGNVGEHFGDHGGLFPFRDGRVEFIGDDEMAEELVTQGGHDPLA